MPNVVGVAPGHNSTVCLMRDGELVFCQSEERLSRIKNHLGLPSATMAHLYRDVIDPQTVDACVVNAQAFAGYYALLKAGRITPTHASFLLTPDDIPTPEDARNWDTPAKMAEAMGRAQRAAHQYQNDPAIAHAAWLEFAAATGVPPDRLIAQNHHLCHALSVLPFLPAGAGTGPDPILILTLDGSGDFLCATVNLYQRGNLQVLSRTPDYASIGRIYELVTGLLGMKIGEHECKVMGLAPYSKSEHSEPLADALRQLVWVNDAGQWQTSVPLREAAIYTLHQLLHLKRFDNVAGGVQMYLEQEVVRWVRIWLAHTGARSLACAGGVFMNVKLNKLLAELDGVDNLTITPSAADESCAIGATVAGHLHLNRDMPIKPARHIYLGQDIADDGVLDAIQALGAGDAVVVDDPDDPEDRIAGLLAAGEVVARCAGAMEFGARSLGNRSILANPSRPDLVMFINEAIKNRDFWMPFAPSVLAERAGDYLVNPKGLHSPYMMIGFDTTERGRRDLAAAIHCYDFTARPQFVTVGANPRYHYLISRFQHRTGIGAVLNTSFNIHGEPVVNSARDAVRTFMHSSLRHLGIGRYLISKTPAI